MTSKTSGLLSHVTSRTRVVHVFGLPDGTNSLQIPGFGKQVGVDQAEGFPGD